MTNVNFEEKLVKAAPKSVEQDGEASVRNKVMGTPTMTVDWKLLDVCNLDCAYCRNGKNARDYILDMGRLGLVADRLLELPRDRYLVNFKGCEATLHPFLPWLIRRLLASGKDIRISVETTGRQNSAYYISLCPEYNASIIQIDLLAHPARNNLKALLILAAELHEKKLGIHFRLFNDVSHPHETALFRDVFSRLARAWRIDFELIAPSDVFAPVLPGSSAEISKSMFCCHGANYIRINPNGSFTGSPCHRAVNWTPVWQGEDNPLLSAAYFVECGEDGEVRECAQLPRFGTRKEAETFIREIKTRNVSGLTQCRLSRASATGSIGKLIESLHKPISALREVMFPINAEQKILDEKLSAIAAILEHCAEPSSRAVYLRALKALQTGDSSWLAKFSMPTEDAKASSLTTCTMKSLRQMLPTLCLNWRQLSLRLEMTSEGLIDVPRLLLEKGFGHNFLFRRLPGAELILATDAPAESAQMPLAVYEEQPYSLCVILHGDGSLDKIRGSVNSLLASCGSEIQILLSGVESKESELRINREYPDNVVIVPKEQTAGHAWLDTAIAMAQCDFIAVLAQGQTVSINSLGADAAALEGADAVAGMYRINGELQGGDKAAVIAPDTALRAWLDSDQAHMLLDCFIFKKSFLVERGINFKASGVYGLFHFLMPALYGANAILQLGPLPYSQGELDFGNILEPSDQSFEDILEVANFVNCFLEDHDKPEIRKLAIERAYFLLRRNMLAHIAHLDKNGVLAESLDNKQLRVLSTCREMLDCLLRDYASLCCAQRKIKPEINPRCYDWRSWKPQNEGTAWVPYRNAEEFSRSIPLLSVIIPAHNTQDYIRDCLDSVLSQSMSNLEVIVVDDASTDATFDILKAYADSDRRIRLYRMEHNCRQGVCRNKAIQAARGRYMVFVDSDDRVEPDFFEKGVSVLENSGASLCLFSYQGKTLDGRVTFRREMKDGIITGQHAFDLCIDFQHTMAPWGKMFRTDFVQASGCCFKEFVYHEDIVFIGDILRKAYSVAVSSFLSYTNIASAQSTIRPKNYEYFQIHSGCILYDYLGKHKPSNHTKELYISPTIIFNLETIHLPAWHAYYKATGELALMDEDYELLQGNVGFMAALIAGLARCSDGGKLPEIQPVRHKLSDRGQTLVARRVSPVISVIVPVYKQETLLERCLDSILEQDFEDFEILVVDDASPDNTWKICEKYSRCDPRIKIFRNERNRGQGYSRNLALEKSSGEYVIYVDSDDYLLPGYFSHAVHVMRSDMDLDLAHFAAVRDTDSAPLYRIGKTPHVITSSIMLERYCRNQETFYSVWANIFRRSFLVDNGIKFTEHFFEDNVFMTAMLSKAGKIFIDQTPVYMRTVTPHSDSTMNPIKCTPRHVRGYFEMCANVFKLLNENGEAGGRADLAACRIGNLCQGFNDSILGYLASFAQKGISPLSNEDLAHLRRTPALIDAMWRHYAKLYAIERGIAKLSFDKPVERKKQEASNCDIARDFAECNRMPKLTLIIAGSAQETFSHGDELVQLGRQYVGSMELILIADETYASCHVLNVEEQTPSDAMIIVAHGPEGMGLAKKLALESANGEYIAVVGGLDTGKAEIISRFMLYPLADADVCMACDERDGASYRAQLMTDNQTAVRDVLSEIGGMPRIRFFKRSFLAEAGIDIGLFNGNSLLPGLQAALHNAKHTTLRHPYTCYEPGQDVGNQASISSFFHFLEEMAWTLNLLTEHEENDSGNGKEYVEILFRAGIFQEKTLMPIRCFQELENIDLANIVHTQALTRHDCFLRTFLAEYPRQ